MKLISMTEFVLQRDKFNVYEANSICNKIVKYAKFIKQILELWMFVPCKLVDGVWVVLEEPDGDNYKSDEEKEIPNFDYLKYKNDSEEYQEAKDRVLFEGWELVNNCRWGAEIAKDKITGALQFNITKYKTVEQLFMDRNLFLTPTAQKQLGL